MVKYFSDHFRRRLNLALMRSHAEANRDRPARRRFFCRSSIDIEHDMQICADRSNERVRGTGQRGSRRTDLASQIRQCADIADGKNTIFLSRARPLGPLRWLFKFRVLPIPLSSPTLMCIMKAAAIGRGRKEGRTDEQNSFLRSFVRHPSQTD